MADKQVDQLRRVALQDTGETCAMLHDAANRIEDLMASEAALRAALETLIRASSYFLEDGFERCFGNGRGTAVHHCQKVGYGSRGERYLTERHCTCWRYKRKRKSKGAPRVR